MVVGSRPYQLSPVSSEDAKETCKSACTDMGNDLLRNSVDVMINQLIELQNSVRCHL